MKISDDYFKPFPEYEEVFYGDLQQYKKHFLPICSINLKFLDTNRDEWFHFVSVKEIYDGQIGQNTQEFHTQYSKLDMIGFDIIDGKYKMEATWDYFEIEHPNKKNIDTSYSEFMDDFKDVFAEIFEDSADDFFESIKKQSSEFNSEGLEYAYNQNETAYLAGKEYYKKYGQIFGSTINNFSSKPVLLEDLERKDEEQKKNYPEYNKTYPEFFDFLDDIKFTSKENKDTMMKYDISLEEMQSFEDTNLIEKPYNAEGYIFEYIGSFTGYFFQKHGADEVYLFYNKDLKKAVVCFEYS
ncbi:hypothetical protein [Flavobacterium sp.]|uniref:hypothetical protein n=1 Tax=Flavobacterium sp. TaxID=239 RepID=UPI002607FA23|nr:hypothetical protein [Flavobacterium sp.]